VSEARSRLKEFRAQRYCPLHRHPVLVDFIEKVSTLYGGKLAECVKFVDTSDATETEMANFEFNIINGDMVVNQGLRLTYPDTDDEGEDGCDTERYAYCECNGTPLIFPPPFLLSKG